MRTLELFAGTQSFTKGVLRAEPTSTCVTVDILPRFRPTIQADLRTWEPPFAPRSFDVVWCSPPCQEYSRAKTVGVRDLSGADALVRRCFEIIDYLKPTFWIIENPESGLLPRRMPTIRQNIPFIDADYCAYGAPYRKRTRFWTNAPLVLRLCEGPGACPQMNENRHKGSCGNTSARYNIYGSFSVWEKDAIPEGLIDAIVAVRGAQ